MRAGRQPSEAAAAGRDEPDRGASAPLAHERNQLSARRQRERRCREKTAGEDALPATGEGGRDDLPAVAGRRSREHDPAAAPPLTCTARRTRDDENEHRGECGRSTKLHASIIRRSCEESM